MIKTYDKSLFKTLIRQYHVYQKINHTPSEIAKTLVDNMIHNKEGILVFNKPHGISFARLEHDRKTNGDDNEISLNALLPHIKNILGIPAIYNVNAPDKYVSGVAIFSTSEDMVEKVRKRFRSLRESGEFSHSYTAVVVGKPQQQSFIFDGGITLKSKENFKGKKVVFIKQWSKNSLKKGNVKRINLSLRIIDSQNHASLVEVSSNENKWNCIRAYLASHSLSPVLGDNLYGSLVKNIMGVPVLVDRFSPIAMLPQKLQTELLAELDLSSRKDVAVPLHLHLNKVYIKNFPRFGENLLLEAPWSEMFKWTCERLNLICSDNNLQKSYVSLH